MNPARHIIRGTCALVLVSIATLPAAQITSANPQVPTAQSSAGLATPPAQAPAASQQPEFVRQGQQLLREGKLDDAIGLYQKTLETSADSVPANNAMGVALDLKGKGPDARTYFAKAIEVAPTAPSRAAAERAMAMSYAFEANCAKTIEYEKKVFDYYATVPDFYQQGEVADEMARVCIDAGDLTAAAKWYQTGHDVGLREPNIKAERKDLWEFRMEHALARIAARRGNKVDSGRHLAAAKGILDKGTNLGQAQFLPYLAGYVAFYGGDYQRGLDELIKANQNDPFIQCLMAQSYEKLGDKEKAMEFYRKAASATGHNPPTAYAQPLAKKKISQ